MTIGLMIIAHDGIGEALMDTATHMLEVCPVSTRVLPVPLDCDCDLLLKHAREMIDDLDDGSGVLILTDMFGGTPANIASRLAEDHRVCVITGANLPMLVRVLNYANLDIREIARKAREGGRDGIFVCPNDTC